MIGRPKETTKMAGRVERIINDKFYFVLDEVGGSSDCESELALDAKPTDNLTQTSDMTNGNDVFVIKDNKSVIDLKSSSLEVTHCASIDENISRHSSTTVNSDQSRERSGGIESINYTNASPNQRSEFRSEESSAVVDMEIDSDVENDKIKPLLRVTFRDEDVEKQLKSSFFKFISQKLENCTIITSSENSLELEVYDKDPKNLLSSDLLDFNLDTTPGDSHKNVPSYGKTHDLVLSDQSMKEKPNSSKSPGASTQCFNCLGNHNLRDCTKSKDFKAININRLKFQSKKDKPTKISRYHLDENQKFSHLTPGAISKKLRNALNLKRDQQPGFIYKMRVLGYPPAWLEEAKVSHSGVAMYDGTGVPVLEEDEEEGEILPEGAKDKFDITKIIEFPGFNVPLPANFKDESKYYQCPALSEEQSKDNLIKLLEPKTVQAYVKKSLTKQKSEEESSSDPKTSVSPTIEEMEEKKRQLLLELSNEDSTPYSKATPEDTPTCQTPVEEPPAAKNVGAVKNLEFGTPVLKSVSPFSKLPSREQFSCNVSNVIIFENLPNSTGKYETMREVISKIRTTTSRAQKE